MKSREKSRARLIARFGWSAGLFEDGAVCREERLRRYRQALERIAAGRGDPVQIAARAIQQAAPHR